MAPIRRREVPCSVEQPHLVPVPGPGCDLAVDERVSRAVEHDGVPEGAERFVPIRSDEERIFTCFLDYHEDTVHVHDLLHRKTADGWQLRISDYLKLRLDTAEIDRRLVALGFSIEDRRVEAGMITVVARKYC